MNSPTIATRLAPEDYDALVALSEREGLTRADLIRRAVADLLASSGLREYAREHARR